MQGRSVFHSLTQGLGWMAGWMDVRNKVKVVASLLLRAPQVTLFGRPI